jgi:osmotically-inducible protein OsmY
MQRLNVEVNDGIAEIRGVAPTEDAKAAVQDIASNTEGVREVRMMMTVGG